jgi:hypothetical protein
MAILDRYPRAQGDRRPQRTNPCSVADLLRARSKIDTLLSLLVASIDSTHKKIHLDIRNLHHCVVRAVGGMSIALDEGQYPRYIACHRGVFGFRVLDGSTSPTTGFGPRTSFSPRPLGGTG